MKSNVGINQAGEESIVLVDLFLFRDAFYQKWLFAKTAHAFMVCILNGVVGVDEVSALDEGKLALMRFDKILLHRAKGLKFLLKCHKVASNPILGHRPKASSS